MSTPNPQHRSLGRCRRRCPHCLVEIDVAKPIRPIGRDSSRSARHSYAAEIKGQILWEATREHCRGFWNRVLAICIIFPEA